jgi:hypothetical protein
LTIAMNCVDFVAEELSPTPSSDAPDPWRECGLD